MKIFSANSFTIRAHQTDDVQLSNAVYEIASRFNHSCYPNAARGFTADLNISIRALRYIKQGDEITLTYLGSLSLDGPTRRKALLDKFGFDFVCEGCVRRIPNFNLVIGNVAYSRREMNQFERKTNGKIVVVQHSAMELSDIKKIKLWFQDICVKLNALADEQTFTVIMYTSRTDVNCNRHSLEEIIGWAMEWTKDKLTRVLYKNSFVLGQEVLTQYIETALGKQRPSLVVTIKQSQEIVKNLPKEVAVDWDDEKAKAEIQGLLSSDISLEEFRNRDFKK